MLTPPQKADLCNTEVYQSCNMEVYCTLKHLSPKKKYLDRPKWFAWLQRAYWVMDGIFGNLLWRKITFSQINQGETHQSQFSLMKSREIQSVAASAVVPSCVELEYTKKFLPGSLLHQRSMGEIKYSLNTSKSHRHFQNITKILQVLGSSILQVKFLSKLSQEKNHYFFLTFLSLLLYQ